MVEQTRGIDTTASGLVEPADIDADAVELWAGPVRVLLVAGELRHVSVGSVEIVSRIYLAIRDRGWNTLRPVLHNLRVDEAAGTFAVRYSAAFCSSQIEDLSCDVEIIGLQSGEIRYRATGVCTGEYPFTKMGICVHHPCAGFAGQAYETSSPLGASTGTLPQAVGRQFMRADGTHVPLFDPYSTLTLHHRAGGLVRFEFEGDLWEIEDHRNWADAGYKSASTPADLGYEFTTTSGMVFEQQVTVTADAISSSLAKHGARGDLAIASNVIGSAPLVGIGLDMPEGAETTDVAQDLLGLLSPSHVRVDVRFSDADWLARLTRSLDLGSATGTPIEVAVRLVSSREVSVQLDALTTALQPSAASVVRFLIFRDTEEVTSEDTLREARVHLLSVYPSVPIFGGTDFFFAEINRVQQAPGAGEGVAWSIAAEVHAFDDSSLMGSFQAQADTVTSAQRFTADAALAVGPITLLPRLAVVGPLGEILPGAAGPRETDSRLAQLFAAAWAVGSYAALAAAGAHSLTYFELLGPNGLLDDVAQATAPVAHVLADLAELAGGRLREVMVANPRVLAATAVEKHGSLRGLIANLTPTVVEVVCQGMPVDHGRCRVLDPTTIVDAQSNPRSFRATDLEIDFAGGALALSLHPFSVCSFEAPLG